MNKSKFVPTNISNIVWYSGTDWGMNSAREINF